MEVQRKRVGRSAPPGLLSVLTIGLLVLKVTGSIGWSWWLVLLPLWGPIAVVLPFVLYFFVSGGIDRLGIWMDEWRIRRRHAGDNPQLWL